MSMSGKSMFLDVVSGDRQVVQYVQLFRMPLFLTVLDEEFRKCDESVWENGDTVREAARKVMPDTLVQFGCPREETDGVIDRCAAEYAKKTGTADT